MAWDTRLLPADTRINLCQDNQSCLQGRLHAAHASRSSASLKFVPSTDAHPNPSSGQILSPLRQFRQTFPAPLEPPPRAERPETVTTDADRQRPSDARAQRRFQRSALGAHARDPCARRSANSRPRAATAAMLEGGSRRNACLEAEARGRPPQRRPRQAAARRRTLALAHGTSF